MGFNSMLWEELAKKVINLLHAIDKFLVLNLLTINIAAVKQFSVSKVFLETWPYDNRSARVYYAPLLGALIVLHLVILP